jgi:hypothetical protein
MDKAKVVRMMVFITHQNSTKVLQPRKQALHFPAPLVTSQLPTILRLRLLAITFVRRNHFNVEGRQVSIQGVRVIRFIANQALRLLVGEAFDQSFPDQGDFVRRSRFCVNGDRKTSAVCHCQELRTLAPLGLSDFCAPFLATINVPFMKQTDTSNLPLVRKSSAKISKLRRSRPSLTHCWKRRWQVWYGGNLSGKSHQRAPERRIHNTPFRMSRSGRRGLPRVWMLCGLSSNELIKDRCSSVSSSRHAIGLI